jgi:hypothetical protein
MLGKLLGRKKAAERFPDESFSIGQGVRDGLPAVAMINVAYKDYSFRSEYPWHVEIQIQIEDRTDVGFPTNEEAGVLNALEDQIERDLRGTGGVHFIARQTWNGVRVLDYYIECERVEPVLANLADSGSVPRSFAFKVERDDAWSACELFFKNF